MLDVFHRVVTLERLKEDLNMPMNTGASCSAECFRTLPQILAWGFSWIPVWITTGRERWRHHCGSLSTIVTLKATKSGVELVFHLQSLSTIH